MTLLKANLNFAQQSLGPEFELKDEGGGLSQAERKQREAAARGALIKLSQGDYSALGGELRTSVLPADDKPPVWMDDLLYLLDHGWPWRQAVYIAWAAGPKINRWPESQELLATQILGLSSDRVISEWRRKNPAIETMIASLQSASLMSHKGDAIAALKASAANADYKNHPDRKLFFEMTGLYTPVSQIRALIASGQLRTKNDVSEMTDDELLQMVATGVIKLPERGEAEDDAG